MSNIFNDHVADNDFRSFSDLLLGTPIPPSNGLTLVPESWGNEALEKSDNGHSKAENDGFKQNRPGNLVLPVPVSPVFAVSPGFSPSVFLNSPTFLSSAMSPFGMSQQQTLVQLTTQAQAALSQSQLGIQAEFNPPSSSVAPLLAQSIAYQPSMFNAVSRQPAQELANIPPHSERKPQTFPMNVDKPADDGYNWRKYGQKQVKGSEYPRSYYRCTTANCPVKKKVERSFDGHITEIIYKGQHNHEPPQTGRRAKDNNISELGSEAQLGNFRWSGSLGRGSDAAQATIMQLNGPSDSEESSEYYEQVEEDDDDNNGPRIKRRYTGPGHSDVPYTHKTMTEPKIVVQTRSEVDLLDDGYRWRKYGQKVVKGNPNPRSYYKCTTVGCKVRKHVERASTDHRAVITTYEGKHNHDVPATRGNNMNVANLEAQQLKLHNSINQMDFGNRHQRPISLRLKEEQLIG